VITFPVKKAAMALHRCTLPALLFALLAATQLSLSSQTAKDPGSAVTTLKASVRLVLVDVVVTNDSGDAITGLHKDDFEISEDGKLQTISTFEEHVGVPPTQVKLPPMPPNVYTNFPVTQTADSVNVILLDALNTPTRDQSYVHAQMLKYLKTIPPGTRTAVFTLASRLRMLQGVTTDASELLALLNSPAANPQQSGILSSDTEKEADQRFIDFMTENSSAPSSAPTTMSQAVVDPINAMKQFLADNAVFETEQRIGLTLEALQQLARYLGTVPGRKNVIWFSGSFPLAIFPDNDIVGLFNLAQTFQVDMRKTADLLSASQMALYPVAAEGLMPDSVYEANAKEIGEKRPALASRDQAHQMQMNNSSRDMSHRAMDELARDTGGRAYYNTNGLSDALARVMSTGSRYYSITYSPSDQAMDGKYRHIQVKLVHTKAQISYRRGYYADDLAAELSAGVKADTDPLLMLMGRNLPDYTQILYKVLVKPLDQQPAADAPRIGSNPQMKGPVTRYGVDFAISVGDLRLDPAPDGDRHGSLEVVLLAYDREGKPLNFVVTRGDVSLKASDYATLRQGGLQIHKEIDVPQEYVYLRTGVYDLRANSAGTLGVPLAVSAPATAAK
jgi:VWFA-related protein